MALETNPNVRSANEEMYNSIRDLLTVKITVPLGDPILKYLHTNMMITCKLSHIFDLSNFDVIGNAMNSNYNRYILYKQDRWYVESITINNDSSKMTADIELNPFPSNFLNYVKNYEGYYNAWANKGSGGSETSSTSSTKSTGSYCTGGEGEFIDNLVRGICGNIADPLERAKAVHNHIKSKQHYSSYACSHYSSAEACYKNITHLNCADMSRLTRAMMASAGLTCYVVHNNSGVGHFWVVIEINGRKYASDNASTATREFDYFWNPITERTEKAVNGGKYYYNRGKNPSC